MKKMRVKLIKKSFIEPKSKHVYKIEKMQMKRRTSTYKNIARKNEENKKYLITKKKNKKNGHGMHASSNGIWSRTNEQKVEIDKDR